MATRIQVVVDEAEREAFRRQAEREGLSLSAWLRQLGRERVASDRPKIRTVDDLRAFFDAIPDEEGPEEDWEVVKARIAASMIEGLEVT